MNFLKNNRSGFTLVEISIVLLIIGIVLAAAITPYKIYRAEQARKETISNLHTIDSALNKFLIQNGRYPCPAPLTAGPGDPQYGVETNCDRNDSGYPTYSYGECVDGVCFERSERATVDVDPGESSVTMAPAVVRRGSIPFRSLGLAELETIDGYNMRIQYALSENLAVTTSFVKESGGISLVDKNGNSMVTSANSDDSVHYIVFSTGKDHNGGYTRDGSLASACDTSKADGENCNTDTAGNAKKAIYSLNEYNESDSADHYDDIVMQYSAIETPLWQVAGSGGYHIRDVLGASGKVGIGVPTPSQKLEVGGTEADVLVEDDGTGTLGKAMFHELCDQGGTGNCFVVEEFGSAPVAHSNFQCGGATPYAVGFENGKIKCSDSPEIKCPSGSKLKGIQSDGSLVCDNVTGCPAITTEVCGVTHTISPKIYTPGTYNSNNYAIVTDGIDREHKFRCKSNGSWAGPWKSGSCSCTPKTDSTTMSCNAYKSTGNWIGDVDVTSTTVCTPGPVTTTTESGASACECVPKSETTPPKACPAGYSGTYTKTRDWVCDGTYSGHWTSWTSSESTDCVCDSSAVDIKDFSCPSGYEDPTGKITKKRNYDCVADSWGPWSEESNTCTCNGSTQVIKQACPDDGDVGEISKYGVYNCATETWDWTVDSTCGPVTYRWHDKSGASGPYSSDLTTKLGSNCDNPGDKTSCSVSAIGGHIHYDVCECE